jgi:hypothetical protein
MRAMYSGMRVVLRLRFRYGRSFSLGISFRFDHPPWCYGAPHAFRDTWPAQPGLYFFWFRSLYFLWSDSFKSYT